MKKLSSMLAISLAMAMTLGMTAFAAVSPDPDTVTVPDETPIESATVDTYVEVSVPDVDLSKYEADAISNLENTQKAQANATVAKTVDNLSTPSGEAVRVAQTPLALEKTAALDAVKEAVVDSLVKKGAITLNDNKTAASSTTVRAAFSLDLASVVSGNALNAADKSAVIGDGIKVGFPLSTSRDKTYLVLHQNPETGKWENVKTEVYDGLVVGTFKSFSPVAIVEVDVKDDGDDGDEPETKTPTTTSATTSPKTAETASAAGVIALAAVATAVVASKKIRYNA